MDLISCRNMLMHLNPDIQARVFRNFRYALNPDGLLFLGSVERPVAESFDAVDEPHSSVPAKTGSGPKALFCKRPQLADRAL
jgi:chemotaxis methyl-accepting protein methylase